MSGCCCSHTGFNEWLYLEVRFHNETARVEFFNKRLHAVSLFCSLDYGIESLYQSLEFNASIN